MKIKYELPRTLCKKLDKEFFNDTIGIWLKLEGHRWEIMAKSAQKSYAEVVEEWYPCPTLEELFEAILTKGWTAFIRMGDARDMSMANLFNAQIEVPESDSFFMETASNPVEALCKCFLKTYEEGCEEE